MVQRGLPIKQFHDFESNYQTNVSEAPLALLPSIPSQALQKQTNYSSPSTAQPRGKMWSCSELGVLVALDAPNSRITTIIDLYNPLVLIALVVGVSVAGPFDT
jgi:hypothetical protein